MRQINEIYQKWRKCRRFLAFLAFLHTLYDAFHLWVSAIHGWQELPYEVVSFHTSRRDYLSPMATPSMDGGISMDDVAVHGRWSPLVVVPTSDEMYGMAL